MAHKRIQVEIAASSHDDHLKYLRWLLRYLPCLVDGDRFQRGGRTAMSSCAALFAKMKARDLCGGHQDPAVEGSHSGDGDLS